MSDTPNHYGPLPKLDWRKGPDDPRDLRYAIRPILRAMQMPAPPKARLYAGPYVKLDQGSEGACVGFGITDELMGTPVRVRPPGYDKAVGHDKKLVVANAFAQHLYEVARRDYDEWPGEDYDGTSVRAGLRAAKAAGYIGEFRWIFDVADFQNTLYWVGPVVIGIPWTEMMYYLDDTYTVRKGGPLVGGHCLCINGIYQRRNGRPQYRARQRWGGVYGDGGDVYFDQDHLHSLMFDGQGGEVAVTLQESYGPTA